MSDQGREIFFIGDIQGCSGPLEALLRLAGFDPDRHRLIPVGDTINRGPDNVGVLTLLRSLGAEPILGNHEARLLSKVEHGEEREWGARQTVGRDLIPHPRFSSFVDWMLRWPLWREGAGWLAVHAGVHPIFPPPLTPPGFLLHVRVCDADGNVPAAWDGHNNTIPEGFFPWHHFYQGDAAVIYGHWARQGLHVTRRTWGLDSGCAYGLRLTGLWWPSLELVDVPGLSR